MSDDDEDEYFNTPACDERGVAYTITPDEGYRDQRAFVLRRGLLVPRDCQPVPLQIGFLREGDA